MTGKLHAPHVALRGALPAVVDSSPGGPPRKLAASTRIFGGRPALVVR